MTHALREKRTLSSHVRVDTTVSSSRLLEVRHIGATENKGEQL